LLTSIALTTKLGCRIGCPCVFDGCTTRGRTSDEAGEYERGSVAEIHCDNELSDPPRDRQMADGFVRQRAPLLCGWKLPTFADAVKNDPHNEWGAKDQDNRCCLCECYATTARTKFIQYG